MTSLIELCLKASQSYVDEEDDVSPQIELVVYSILYVGSQTNWVLSSSDDRFLVVLLASVPDSGHRSSIFKVVLAYDDEHVISADSLNQIYNLPVDTYRHKSEEEQLEFQQSFLQLINEDQRYTDDGEFVPTLKISTDGVPDYEDYYDQIEDYAPDEVERIKLINRLLLDEQQQFMYQALLHKYGIEGKSYKDIWITLMSNGYSSIDQVIPPENLRLTIFNLNRVMAEAVRGGHKEIVEMMIARGATGFNYAMEQAAKGGHKEIVEMLIAAGATDFNLAMADAAEEGQKEIVELMLAHGATNFNWTMTGAAEGGHKEIVEMMIARGATYFNLAMAYAARGGYKEIVELMIEYGADDFNWAMREAAREGHQDIVDLLQPYMN